MVFTDEVYITPFESERTLHIYVPDDLEEDERCNVIYMFDGHNLFYDDEATYGKSWGLKDYLDETHDRVIVVGIECNHEGNMRLCEFSPYDFEDGYYGFVEGMGKDLVDWIVYELKPYIDENLPTIPDRWHTAIGGSSMGGLMALYAGIAHSETFSKNICISPYIQFVTKNVLREIRNSIDPFTEFYVSWGTKEDEKLKDLFLYQDNIFKIQRKLSTRAVIYLHQYLYHRHTESDWEKETKVWMKELKLNQL